ncbi:hypothetical protein [Bacillus mojavensis]
MNKIHRVLSYEAKNLSILTDRLNKDIDNYDNWKTDLRIDVNRESGYYYYILTVYK